MTIGKILTLAAASVAISTGIACAVSGEPEHKIDLKETPSAVQAAIVKAVGDGKLESIKRETENGAVVFEAEFEVGEVDHSVKVSDAGAVLEEETELKISEIPTPVTDAVRKAHPDAKIEDASEVTAGGKKFIEVSFKTGKEEREMKVDAAGTVLSDKVEEEEKDGDQGHQDKDDDKNEKK